jgi:uncharacterized membrane protein required for colicin V production
MKLDALPFNAFDVGLIVLLGMGISSGRKRGMSEELMDLIKWVAIVVACGFLYEPVGGMIAESCPFSLLASYLAAYVGGALVIYGFFAMLKRGVGGKLVGSDIFGHSEYYLGMGAAVMRYVCVLIFGLAVLNARYFSPMEVKAREKYQMDNYNSEFFPGLDSAQAAVFQKSLTGPWIQGHLGFLLIKPTAPDTRDLPRRDTP